MDKDIIVYFVLTSGIITQRDRVDLPSDGTEQNITEWNK